VTFFETTSCRKGTHAPRHDCVDAKRVQFEHCFAAYGSLFATPVINQPQVAILGVGAVEKQPVVVDDAIAIRSVCYLALTFDHRLIDGAMADQYCQKVKSILENWSDQVL
jgi:pyruvate dehydrogenase E2 component (dihydrolipoamide acetyltransferase)